MTDAAQGVYQQLGVRPVINACATVTRLGGSLMPAEVVAAMAEAARSFVDIIHLQERVGQTLAELTRNEAAFVTNGAAAGIVLTVAACMTRGETELLSRLPETAGLKNEALVFKNQRTGYDFAIRQTGCKLVTVGDGKQAHADDLERAISERTALLIWFQGRFCGTGDLPLPQVIEVCARRGVPVLVDAAAQLPPVENLWHFTQLGAAGAIFSGGKDLHGPQASGLVVGQRWLIEAMRPIASPNAGIGRPMKVGKEEMIGLLAAVRRYVGMDHAARRARDERVVSEWCAAFNRLPGVQAWRDFPNEAGQPLPRCEVAIGDSARLSHDETLLALRAGTPSIETGGGPGGRSFHLNAMLVTDEEAAIIQRRIVELLA